MGRKGSGGFEGRGIESPSEPDTPSRKSYMSSTDSGESGDSRSEEELQGVTRKKRTATDLLFLTRLFGT